MKKIYVAVLLCVLVVFTASGQVSNMVWIPAGTFKMGSEDNTPFDGKSTKVKILISKGFWIGKCETTQAEYVDTIGTNPSYFNGYESNPVDQVSWFDAVNYCEKLNTKEKKAGRLPAGYKYRLPTKAEWEYACRAGTDTRYSFGDDYSLLGDYAWYNKNSTNDVPSDKYYEFSGKYFTCHKVGEKFPNNWGLYDMLGNVSEWCLNWASGDNHNVQDGDVDPVGPLTGEYRVICGGSWVMPEWGCRSASQVSYLPDYKHCRVGFRPVLAWDFTNWTTDVFEQLPRPVQPTYSTLPNRNNKKKIIVVHGWQPAWEPVDIAWVDTMTNAINKYLIVQALTDWEVCAYKWVERAKVSIKEGGPQTALNNGKEEGVNLGKCIADQNIEEVHLIAHSAGASLIQAASDTIKFLRPKTIVHLTFLDPFVGFDYEGVESYGNGADWSDNYFSRDFWTSGGIFKFTQSQINAYNVDVSLLDTNLGPIQVNYSTPDLTISETCYHKIPTHSGPYQVYVNTIPPNKVSDSKGFGFPLSREGGNWEYATNNYKAGKNTLEVLGSDELSCPLAPPINDNPFQTDKVWDFSQFTSTSVILNSSEHVIIHGIDFELRTASPAWLVVVVPITNTANFISFEAQFMSAASGSEGLLSVYWETNTLQSIDERMTLPGKHRHTLPLPETVTNGTRTVCFRLDTFSTTQSSVTISNVMLGFAGEREQFSLSFTGTKANNGLPILQLVGPIGFNYIVETSENLAAWKTMAVLINIDGIVRFVDTSTNNSTARFYRAIAP